VAGTALALLQPYGIAASPAYCTVSADDSVPPAVRHWFAALGSDGWIYLQSMLSPSGKLQTMRSCLHVVLVQWQGQRMASLLWLHWHWDLPRMP